MKQVTHKIVSIWNGDMDDSPDDVVLCTLQRTHIQPFRKADESWKKTTCKNCKKRKGEIIYGLVYSKQD